MKADFGKTAQDYRKHRAGFPESFFAELRKRQLIRGRETVIDLGTGTGTVARGLASEGCTVTGIDPSKTMLEQAKELALEANLDIIWKTGRAEAMDTPSGSVDRVTAGQCWHWFEAEPALNEVKRVLRPGGILIIAHFDWLPLSGNVVSETEKLIEAVNPAWDLGGGTGIYPEWFRQLGSAGFHDIESFSYDESIRYSHEAWCGRIRASAGIGGSLQEKEIEDFDAELRELLKDRFPEDPLLIPHRIFAVWGRNSAT